MPLPTVLVIEDDPIAMRVLCAILRNGHQAVPCADPRLVSESLAAAPVDVVLMDLNLPHLGGEELLPRIQADHPDLPVIVVTGTQDATVAVRLVKKGAFDYLVKPVDPRGLVAAVARALQVREANRAAAAERPVALRKPQNFARFVTASKAMQRLFEYIEAVAPSPNPVLVTGETGTGKELVAQAIHAASGRGGECVACNVGGLDDALLSDALFGHRKGSFTGAVGDRAGLVERAAGGTLFLDEIGDLPLQSQVKLLRLLQEQEYLPVGLDVPRRADIRVVAATSLDLDQRIADGRFRRDLFYRLCGHRVHLPPLRERREDVPVLIAHFARVACEQAGIGQLRVPSAVLDLVATYGFPGNVRELQALIHDAVSRRKGGQLSVEPFRRLGQRPGAAGAPALPPPALGFPGHLPTIEEAVEQLVQEALRRSDGNQAAAARLLGISRQALGQRLKSQGRRRAIEGVNNY
ncbi:MAG: sigma-54 dependent transcriptional regulator [Planctomycetes bacterium]|nr:sigma-54 dependent transcriptional regulator [Planctomycetota bacterium]